MNDTSIHDRQQIGGELGFRQRPALLLVDLVNGFVDQEIFGGGNIAAATRAPR